MFVKLTTLAAAVLVSGFAIAQQQQQPQQQQQQPRSQQSDAIQNQPKAPECWDIHTNQVRETTAADSQASQQDSTVGSARSNAPANSKNITPGGKAQRPAGMASC
jgi:cytoskeletal protein RodZ